jgi:8-oxo-dGTP pyrophosphatase MutT (NUDIX family)
MRDFVTKKVNSHTPDRMIPASIANEGEAAALIAREATDRSTDAAVLVPLVERAAGMTVLLTQRTDHLRDHAGQISFPGGRVEPEDHDSVDTALREAEEEIGLARDRVDIVGRLDTCLTGTGFRVVPVVGLIGDDLDIAALELDAFEVAEAFEVPLSFVLDPANHVRRTAVARGRRREFYVLPYQDRYIWGATARMLVNLHEVLDES